MSSQCSRCTVIIHFRFIITESRHKFQYGKGIYFPMQTKIHIYIMTFRIVCFLRIIIRNTVFQKVLLFAFLPNIVIRVTIPNISSKPQLIGFTHIEISSCSSRCRRSLSSSTAKTARTSRKHRRTHISRTHISGIVSSS